MATTDESPPPTHDSTRGKLEQLRELRDRALHAGNESAVEKHHAAGKLLARERVVRLLDPGSFDAPSTKTAVGLLDGRTGGNVLIVVAPDQDVAAKSFRNLNRVTVLPVEAVGVADLIRAAQFVATEAALDALTARAKKTSKEAVA